MRYLLIITIILCLGCGDDPQESNKLTFDTCPMPNFDVDWEGKGVFQHQGHNRGRLLLSNGVVGVLLLSGAAEGNYDLLVGGRVTSPTNIEASHIAINSIVDGRITFEEVEREESEISKIFLIRDNQMLHYQLILSEGSFSAVSGCQENHEYLDPELVARILPLAEDMINIIGQDIGVD